MAGPDIVKYYETILRPDPARTVVRPFMVSDPDGYGDKARPREVRIVDRVLGLDDASVQAEYAIVGGSLDSRHRDVDDTLWRRFEEVDLGPIDKSKVSRAQALLIGAYFSEEYSFEAAALFNPSIVLHPDQSSLAPDTLRFILSLRGIGEGHVSSATFRSGTWGPGGITVDTPSESAVAPQIDRSGAEQAHPVIRLDCNAAKDISEVVFFPMTAAQARGFEDLRLTRFADDDGRTRYVGTFTAFSGADVHTDLVMSDDFKTFEVRPISGSVANSKGMAMFPRRIGGRYAMLGRQDNENIWLLTSEDLCTWNGGDLIVRPEYPWEFIQIGNCGSPIELDEGWLVLTHGVGTVRNYCMGACLLDKDDPRKLLARLEHPLIQPSEKQRDGYVPNVVYSCGALLNGRHLLIPYGVADNFAAFASVVVDDLLKAMVWK